jgi:hypothetical protein
MANHLTISTESDLASPALPTTAVTRRSLLGGAGIAVGAAVLASPPSMPGISGAACERGPATSTQRSSAAPSKSERSARATTRKFPSRPTRRKRFPTQFG